MNTALEYIMDSLPVLEKSAAAPKAGLKNARLERFLKDTIQDAVKDTKKKSLLTPSNVVGGTLLGGWALAAAVKKIRTSTVKQALIEDLMRNDPVISDEEPDTVLSYYATINTLAPDIAKDKNAVRELLQNFIKFGRIDMQSIKTLAEIQGKLHASGINPTGSILGNAISTLS